MVSGEWWVVSCEWSGEYVVSCRWEALKVDKSRFNKAAFYFFFFRDDGCYPGLRFGRSAGRRNC